MPQEQARTMQAGHGRIETRVLTIIPDEAGYLDWPGLGFRNLASAQRIFEARLTIALAAIA